MAEGNNFSIIISALHLSALQFQLCNGWGEQLKFTTRWTRWSKNRSRWSSFQRLKFDLSNNHSFVFPWFSTWFQVTLKEMLVNSSLRKPLIIAMMMMLAQQLSGINCAMFYSTSIFSTAGLSMFLERLLKVEIPQFQTLAQILRKASRRPWEWAPWMLPWLSSRWPLSVSWWWWWSTLLQSS